MAGRKVKPVTQADLSRLKGCTRQAVQKQIKGALAVALLPDGLVDAAHPAVVDWLNPDDAPTPERKPVATAPSKPTRSVKSTRIERAEPTALPDSGDDEMHLPDDGTVGAVANINDIPFGELIRRFGTGRAFKLWTDGLKDIELIRKTRIQNDEAEDLSVRREAIQIFVFGAIESMNRRLLRDTAKTLASRAMSLVRSGGTLEEIEALYRDSISTALSEVKSTALRILKPQEDEKSGDDGS